MPQDLGVSGLADQTIAGRRTRNRTGRRRRSHEPPRLDVAGGDPDERHGAAGVADLRGSRGVRADRVAERVERQAVPAGAVEALDGVVAATPELVAIGPEVPEQQIVAGIAEQGVVTLPTVERIAALAAIERVGLSVPDA